MQQNHGQSSKLMSDVNSTVPGVLFKESSSEDILLWSFVCLFFLLFGLGLATAKFLCDVYSRPENKKKRKERKEQAKRQKELKAVAAVKRNPIPSYQFLTNLNQKKVEKNFNIEVRAIVKNQEEFSSSVAMKPENLEKNVLYEVVPYDHTRIVLENAPEGESDYINASFVDGYGTAKEYISSQGPQKKNVPSFWQMVWQEEVQCIVMTTGLFQHATQQCDKYWEDGSALHNHVQHGDIHIWVDKTDVVANLTVRKLRISKLGYAEERSIRQFELSAWINDEETDPGLILEWRRQISNYMSMVSGPLLVHCRCGGGRTAVYIAVDYCLKQLEAEDSVDVYSAILHLRRYRKNMIRTLAQYKLIYDSLARYILMGLTVISSTHLAAIAQRMSIKDPHTKQQGFEKEFQVLQTTVVKLTVGDCAGGHRMENRNKSRDIMLQPPERARPYLFTSDSNESTDFINAVYVDGYFQENNFIVTQWPLRNTVNDVWRLIYDHKVSSVVLLNNVKFSRNFPCFWPKSRNVEVKYGPIAVQCLSTHKYSNIVVHTISIRKNLGCMPLADVAPDISYVRIFQLTCWGSKEKVPSSTRSLIYMMGLVEDWQQQMSSGNPILVMSKEGSSRCGIYCALSVSCDKLRAEGEVDVFNAVRLVKKNRTQLVPNIVEYIYCYTFLITLLELMQEDTPKIVVTMPGSSEGRVHKSSTVKTGTQHHSEVDLSRRTSCTWSYHTASLEDPLDGFFSVHESSHSINQLPGLSPLLSHQLHVPHNRSGISLDSMCDSENNNAEFSIPNMQMQNIGSGMAWKPEYHSSNSNKVSFTLGGKIPKRTLSPPFPKTVDVNENNEMSFQVKTKFNDNKHYLSLPDATYDRNGISLMDTSNNNTITTASNGLQQQTVELLPLCNTRNADKKVHGFDGAYFNESSHL